MPYFTRDELESLMNYVDSGADSWMGSYLFNLNQEKILELGIGNYEDILENELISINFNLEKIRNITIPENYDVDTFEILTTGYCEVLV